MDLGRDDDFLTGNFQIFENFAQLLFCLTNSVYLRSIKVIYAILETYFDYLFVLFVGLGLVVDHVA